MYSADEIVKTAQEIRPYLPQLLDAPSAQQVDSQLAQLLVRSQDAPATQQIVELLTQREPTREWMRLSLEEHYPVETIFKTLRTYHPLSGSDNSIESPRYICTVASCHQSWYRRDQSVGIPRCPIHDVQMVRDSKAH
ncbi:MAG TPA: hypothetical protein V6D29_05535 [Leptolyngbyaceae cyanobacterium]